MGAVITVIILEIVLHIVIAAFNHKDADQPRDETDRLFTMKAGNISGWVLGIAVLMIAAHTFIQDLDSTWVANLLLFAVFAIEKGKYSPSLEVAFKIAETFSVTLDKVFQYQGSEKLTLPDTDSPGFIGLLSRPVQSTRMVGPLNLG